MANPRSDPDRVTAVYRVEREAAASGELARLIAIEQTVEIPEALIPPGKIQDEVVGRVESVTPDPEAPGAHRITISYGAELAVDLFGLLAVAIGNAPMYGGVRLVELRPPRSAARDAAGAQPRGGGSAADVRGAGTAAARDRAQAAGLERFRAGCPSGRRSRAAAATW